MANIFQVNDNTPSGVGRSVQPGLTRRFTFDTKYGLIVPNFVQYLYPGESLRLRPTSFIRTVNPLNRPQLSRVRFVQRFYKIDLRTMFLAWEDFIKGTETLLLNGSDEIKMPYVCNVSDNYQMPNSPAEIGTRSTISGTLRAEKKIGAGYAEFEQSFNISSGWPRRLVLDPQGYPYQRNSDLAIFGIHELGDYLDCAVHVPYEAGGTYYTGVENYDMLHRNAFDFAAYQLIYSFGFRQPRVQKRIDDFYEMAAEVSGYSEFTPYTRAMNVSGGVWYRDRNAKVTVRTSPNVELIPVDGLTATYASGNSKEVSTVIVVNQPEGNKAIGEIDSSTGEPYFKNKSESTSVDDINRTSWESVEHWPLKSGTNVSMLAMSINDSGFPEFRPSAISLTRMRYANWLSDRFVTATFTPQEGDEAQIPVQGSVNVTLPDSTTVTLSNLSATVPHTRIVPEDVVTGGLGSQVSLTEASASGDVTKYGSVYAYGLSSGDLNNARLVFPTTYISVSGSSTAQFSSNSANAIHSLSISPSDFRFYMQLQKIKEMQQATDNRYKSYITKFFGSHVPDSQLDRPQFLGGYVQDLNVSEVTQTSETSENSELGSVAGKIVDGKTGRSIRVHADQHCIVMGVCFIMPDTEYVGGQNREFVTETRFDWMLPQFANISKQAIYNYELAYSVQKKGAANAAHAVFGYEPVYNYLRWSDNRAVGVFRDYFNSTGNAEEFKPWIVKRYFGDSLDFKITGTSSGISIDGVEVKPAVPTLSDEFLSMRFGVDDSNFAVDSETLYPFIVDSYFDIRAVRKIPSVGIARV